MSRTQSRWLVVGSLVAAGMASLILSVVSLSGFAAPPGGDSMTTQASGLAPTTLLLGTLALLGLEVAHALGRRATRAS
ncbi:MAG: hypothetical protein ACHQ01_04095 [Candidatus Limnocylindrales bacterium]